MLFEASPDHILGDRRIFMDITFEIVDPDEHHPNHYLVLAALEPGLTPQPPPVKVYSDGMKMKAGTIQQFFEALVADLSREPKDEEERQQIEAEKTALRNAFIRMASMPKIHMSRYSFPLSLKAQIMIRRAGDEVEPEPLPPLPPGKARLVSF